MLLRYTVQHDRHTACRTRFHVRSSNARLKCVRFKYVTLLPLTHAVGSPAYSYHRRFGRERLYRRCAVTVVTQPPTRRATKFINPFPCQHTTATRARFAFRFIATGRRRCSAAAALDWTPAARPGTPQTTGSARRPRVQTRDPSAACELYEKSTDLDTRLIFFIFSLFFHILHPSR